jgi:hypothetical protein
MKSVERVVRRVRRPGDALVAIALIEVGAK